MRVRIWNAFASNNSGSYVIVGRFPSEALAAEVAAELLEVAKAQAAWRFEGPEPLTVYAARHGVPNGREGDDWPDDGRPPAVWAVGHQVFVHCGFTLSMPRAIGHLMYARGGRVETELDHAHHAIAAFFDVQFPWKTRATVDVRARVQDLVEALWTEDGALSVLDMAGHPPAWRDGASGPYGEPDLVIGAAFRNLCAGFTAIAAACAAVGAEVRVRVFESPATADPFAHLRPSRPQPPCP